MNVSRWNLKEFNDADEQDLVVGIVPINSEHNPDQDNTAEPLIHEDFVNQPLIANKHNSDIKSDTKNYELDLAKFKLEKSILEQNIATQNVLSDIKAMLIDIEKQQNTRLEELSRNVLLFIKNLANKILANSLFSSVVTEVAINHINEIISKVKNSSSLSIMIPRDMSEVVKSSLLTTFKSTASKLNIEVIEHEDVNKNITVEWKDGRAELQLDNSIKIIEQELEKFDSNG